MAGGAPQRREPAAAEGTAVLEAGRGAEGATAAARPGCAARAPEQRWGSKPLCAARPPRCRAEGGAAGERPCRPQPLGAPEGGPPASRWGAPGGRAAPQRRLAPPAAQRLYLAAEQGERRPSPSSQVWAAKRGEQRASTVGYRQRFDLVSKLSLVNKLSHEVWQPPATLQEQSPRV